MTTVELEFVFQTRTMIFRFSSLQNITSYMFIPLIDIVRMSIPLSIPISFPTKSIRIVLGRIFYKELKIIVLL